MDDEEPQAGGISRDTLAMQRTIMASERTLMAWIRTSFSMIGFGFTIYKFFQYLREAEQIARPARPHAPRNLGMSLVVLGTLALIAATAQHWQLLKQLGVRGYAILKSLSFVVAALVSLIGILAFAAMVLRTGPF